MAENKKSFVLYSDCFGLIKQLPDDVAGRLLKHIYAYVNDENPISDELLLNVAFEPIKMQLKRDLLKWESQIEQRRNAGIKSAEVRKRNATSVNERSISSTDNVNVTVNDNVNVNEININVYRQFAQLSISIDEVEKLKIDYDIKTIDLVLDSIENYKDNKKYKSLYLTAKKWLLKEPKKSSLILQSTDEIRKNNPRK